MFTIALANEKGGVAKTTTTISLGSALADLGHRVLIIDLDPQANLTLSTGYDPRIIDGSIADILLNNEDPSNFILNTKTCNLNLIPSSPKMNSAERFLTIRKNYTTLLKENLDRTANKFDYVLLDCPPYLGAVTQNALVASNTLIIPTQAEFFSIFALRNLMDLIGQVRSGHNPRLTYRLLMTMYDRRNRIHRVLLEQLKTTFEKGVFNTIIEIDTKLRESQLIGIPIQYHAPKSRSALQYNDLALELIDYVKKANIQPA